MRRNPTKHIEQGRITDGVLASTRSDGANGMFIVEGPLGVRLNVMASDGAGWCLPGEPWEHVSVSTMRRCPTWEEMDFIKRLFWRDDEVVVQLHVPREVHVNQHQYCLHLWKPTNSVIPMPPVAAV